MGYKIMCSVFLYVIKEWRRIRGVQLALMSAHMSAHERFSLTLAVSVSGEGAHAHGERER
jgi:hypothetical protein